MIIDAYTHILPKKYQENLERLVGQRDQRLNTARYAQLVPTLGDLDARFRLMDKFDGYIQVISIASPHIYEIAPPAVAVELCKIANDELAELIFKYPERFAGGIASLPLSDVDASIKEAERAMKDLRLKAVEFTAVVTGKPLDAPEFLPLYEKMAETGPPDLHPSGP